MISQTDMPILLYSRKFNPNKLNNIMTEQELSYIVENLKICHTLLDV